MVLCVHILKHLRVKPFISFVSDPPALTHHLDKSPKMKSIPITNTKIKSFE